MKRWFNYLLGACLVQPLFAVSAYAVQVTESTPVYVAPGVRGNNPVVPAQKPATQNTTVKNQNTVQNPENKSSSQYVGNESSQAVAAKDETDDVEDFGIITDSVQAANPLADDRSLLVGELQTLRAVVEQQAKEIGELKQRNKALYQDLDRRIQLLSEKVVVLEKRKPSVATASPVALDSVDSEADVTSADDAASKETDQTRYRKAKAILDEGGRDTKAALEFVKLLRDYPDTPLKPNVYYWLAQIYKRGGEVTKAESFYNRVLEEYPTSIKAASSLYSLAALKASNGQEEDAKVLWGDLLKKYPKSAEAVKAKAKLESLQ
ncbi:tetratricopeptide repeat protein [Litoribacillus peritrichatus]|uniref:YbgF trimerisation domain-containing protein n=1 Tax=Litoribacillus peritrichatus TaxID=718191 RepID=A0ABP7NA00_9GAMM